MQKSEVQEIVCKKCRDLWPMSKCNQHAGADEGTVMFENEMGDTVRIGENDTKRALRQAWEKVLREKKLRDLGRTGRTWRWEAEKEDIFTEAAAHNISVECVLQWMEHYGSLGRAMEKFRNHVLERGEVYEVSAKICKESDRAI